MISKESGRNLAEEQVAIEPNTASNAIPSRVSVLVFGVKANLLRLRRALHNVQQKTSVLTSGNLADYPYLIAESCTPLWTETTLSERALQWGKVHNLRIAVRRLQQLELPADAVFSFWKQVGRASRRRGYTEGRQISEGCLVPAIGGGLCQLSNALYEVALQTGLEIVERHPHSRIVPGSAAETGRDATVFWNYLDLRFRAHQPLMLTASLSSETLTVRIYSKTPQQITAPNRVSLPLVSRPVISIAEHSCGSCDADCFRRRPKSTVSSPHEEKRAFLVDRASPEFMDYLRQNHNAQDVLGIPLDGRKQGKPQYAWDTENYARVEAATWQTLRRALRSRRLSGQGAERQKALLEAAEQLANRYAALVLTPDVTRICVDQTLLPFLWRSGHLGGRCFDMLMTRLPIAVLETTLDQAALRYPQCRTLTDFRASSELRDAETEALASAKKIITPHSAIAGLFPNRADKLDWILPEPKEWIRGDAILFPHATLARKGAYTMRDAARQFGFSVMLMGGNYEGVDFWDGVQTLRVPSGANPFTGIRAVVSPALMEDSPRLLLQAVASGVPVYASAACGLDGIAGVTEIAPDCVEALSLLAANITEKA